MLVVPAKVRGLKCPLRRAAHIKVDVAPARVRGLKSSLAMLKYKKAFESHP